MLIGLSFEDEEIQVYRASPRVDLSKLSAEELIAYYGTTIEYTDEVNKSDVVKEED